MHPRRHSGSYLPCDGSVTCCLEVAAIVEMFGGICCILAALVSGTVARVVGSVVVGSVVVRSFALCLVLTPSAIATMLLHPPRCERSSSCSPGFVPSSLICRKTAAHPEVCCRDRLMLARWQVFPPPLFSDLLRSTGDDGAVRPSFQPDPNLLSSLPQAAVSTARAFRARHAVQHAAPVASPSTAGHQTAAGRTTESVASETRSAYAGEAAPAARLAHAVPQHTAGEIVEALFAVDGLWSVPPP